MPNDSDDLRTARLRYLTLAWAVAHAPHSPAGDRAFAALYAAALETADAANARHGAIAINAESVYMACLTRGARGTAM